MITILDGFLLFFFFFFKFCCFMTNDNIIGGLERIGTESLMTRCMDIALIHYSFPFCFVFDFLLFARIYALLYLYASVYIFIMHPRSMMIGRTANVVIFKDRMKCSRAPKLSAFDQYNYAPRAFFSKAIRNPTIYIHIVNLNNVQYFDL
jgi:hypothetical protein